jgi:Biotin-lipoyl like
MTEQTMRWTLVLPVLLIAVLSGCRSEVSAAAENSGPQAVTVSTGTAVSRDVPASFDERGSFVAEESSNIAPPVAGRIVCTPVEAGTFVKKGQVIAELDHRDSKLRLQQNQAQLEEATIAVQQAQVKIGLKSGAFDPNNVPEVAVARANYESAQAQAKLADANAHRYANLVETGDVSRSAFEQAQTQLKTLLLRISDHDEGIYVAVEILYMGLFSGGVSVSPKEFVEIGCELMRRLNITRDTGPNFAQRLQIIGKHCLIGDAGAATVREVCTKLKEAISRSEASACGHREFLQVLFSAQPLAVLQSLCSGDATMVKIGISVLENADLLHPHAFDVIPEGELLRWCNELPDVRYPIAASGIAAIGQDEDGPHWTDIALKILEKSPDRVRVLQKFIQQFSLPGWDLSRAAEVQANLRLLDDFAGHPDPNFADFAKSEKSRLSQAIAEARKVRHPIYMERDEGSFE